MITQALVSNGAKVYITGRREEALESTVEKYNNVPGSLHHIVADVSRKDEAVRLAKELEQKEPKGIQLLVNNAGIARDDHTKFSSAGQPRCQIRRPSRSTSSRQRSNNSWTPTRRTSWDNTLCQWLSCHSLQRARAIRQAIRPQLSTLAQSRAR